MRTASLLLRSTLLAAGLFLISTSTASSGVPSPANSTHDPCFVVCPLGDITYHVTVRDIANNPVAGSTVVLDFSQCVFVHCQNPGPGIVVNDALHTMTAITNAAGVASFPLKMGGCCPAVRIVADGVVLATVSMTSPDQDANLTVNGADASILTGLMSMPYNVCGDLNCDGLVGATDLSALIAHNGHACSGVVPTRLQSWGMVKTFYR
jgi:hypothetical protein